MRPTLYFLLAALSLLSFQFTFSQAICGFDAVHNRKLQEDRNYQKNVLAGESAIRTYVQAHPGLIHPGSVIPDKAGAPVPLSGGPHYTIPVVVHVVHTGGTVGSIYNPSDAQIIGAINYLNAVYNGTYPGIQGAGDLQIQFVLAQRDPNCNLTNGINRIDGSSIPGYASEGVQAAQTTIGTADINIKNLIRWDPTQYYNVWVVDKIDGNDGTSGQFIAGFAYFPGSGNEDGIVMLATQMISGQKTLPHEIGHAFSLLHPFEGSAKKTVCPDNTNCTGNGDKVCDTDPISYNFDDVTGVIDFSCRTGTNPCTGTPYSINTENNFMNYTNCYTLFTPGQKARMLASAASTDRLSLSTSLGSAPPGSAGSPCAPKINFELTSDQETETTAAFAGCRAYKDYPYNMVIGVAPSVTATATLNIISGTAVQGIDFDITTNNSFSAPGTSLSFPAGATTSQPFTIRIYDDAVVNGTRQFTLGFTVNSGGGNAIAGDGKPNFTMTIHDNDVAPTAGNLPTGVATIGVHAGFLTGTGPFNAIPNAARFQFQYKAGELTAAGIPAGNISAISFNLSKTSTRPVSNLNIKLGRSSASYLVNGVVTPGSSMTVVKTLATYSTANGWNNFTFDTPYTWDGISNLVVEICYDNGTAAAGDAADAIDACIDGGGTLGNFMWQTGINCAQSFTSVTYDGGGAKPIARITYGITPTAVQTALNSSIQQELGPAADVYFYDQTNGQLMARIKNLSSFDYGCTKVIIDRAGTGATPFWNNNVPNYLMDKTFHVLPTNNSPTGVYNITVFYTQAEVNGWHSITGQSVSAIQLVKVPNQIKNVTIANPTAENPVTLVTPTISTLGANTALSYTFVNGFSGFGAGVPGLSVLPIGLLNFEGELKDNDALLKWSTSFEAGSKGFEIERSYDGRSFTNIGYVAAAGNSTSTRSYTFTDPLIAQENNYYRLRQIDQDGKFTYSKVIQIQDPNPVTRAFTLLSNPFTDHIDLVFGQTPVGPVNIRLLDMTGRELLSRPGITANGSRMRIDLSGTSVSAGIYLLELRFNNSLHVEKIFKR